MLNATSTAMESLLKRIFRLPLQQQSPELTIVMTHTSVERTDTSLSVQKQAQTNRRVAPMAALPDNPHWLTRFRRGNHLMRNVGKCGSAVARKSIDLGGIGGWGGAGLGMPDFACVVSTGYGGVSWCSGRYAE